MRILLTTESYLPYVSGVTVAVDALARGLGSRGHDVFVLAPRPVDGRALPDVGSPGPAPRHAWLPSYQLPRPVPPGYRMPLPVPSRALAAARAFRAEVVHAQSPFVTGLLARRLAREAGAPLVFTHHTRFGDYAHYAGPFAAAIAGGTGAYLRRWWSACDAVVAPSSELADEIRVRVPGLRVEVIPTGVDVDGLRALSGVDPRPLAGWPADTLIAASLGRLAPEKSPDEILEAAALAAASEPRLRLLVVGGGPSEAALRRRAGSPDLQGRVEFTGLLPRIEALARVGGADVFVFASRTETQGLVLAEALSVGLPTVAVAGPGVRDTLRDGVDGVIVGADPPSSRPARLAAALVGLATDDERRDAMATAARAGAARFSLDRRIDDIESLYRSVVRRDRGANRLARA